MRMSPTEPLVTGQRIIDIFSRLQKVELPVYLDLLEAEKQLSNISFQNGQMLISLSSLAVVKEEMR